MFYTPETILEKLINQQPQPTANMPRNARGIYGLVDHLGDLRYIGSTSAEDETLYKRIHQRHRTGSEGSSHYFSRMYNTGRMWRDRNDNTTALDGLIAKELRNEFIADHCKAVYVEIPDTINIFSLEQSILAIAPANVIAWNARKTAIYSEPTELVDATLKRLNWSQNKLDAIKRQQERYLTNLRRQTKVKSQRTSTTLAPFPKGEFRFFALDVETANNDRSSICQIGIACVKADSSIVTWQTYIDPKTNIWAFTYLHGISARTIIGAPSFEDVFNILQDNLKGHIVFQHSCFDQNAIAAACRENALSIPLWQWRDSVQVARLAWPELKGNGGHGLASLKKHLKLEFHHHDAEEDARASAEVVLRAEIHAPNVVALKLPQKVFSNLPEYTLAEDASFNTATNTDTLSNTPKIPHLVQIERIEAPKAQAVKPLPKNPIRDAILQKIAANSAILVHPMQKNENGTKYLSAFILAEFTFVIDKMSAGKQPIWVLDKPQFHQYLVDKNIQYDEYPANKGRNSNLHKIPNFKTGALLRIYPNSVEQAMLLISDFATNPI